MTEASREEARVSKGKSNGRVGKRWHEEGVGIIQAPYWEGKKENRDSTVDDKQTLDSLAVAC